MPPREMGKPESGKKGKEAAAGLAAAAAVAAATRRAANPLLRAPEEAVPRGTDHEVEMVEEGVGADGVPTSQVGAVPGNGDPAVTNPEILYRFYVDQVPANANWDSFRTAHKGYFGKTARDLIPARWREYQTWARSQRPK